MPKKFTRKRRVTRRKRSTSKRSGKFARKQQSNALTFVKKRYSRVFLMTIPEGQDAFESTISLIGGKNSSAPFQTVSIADVNQDNQLTADMLLYQFFKITGCAIKQIFPMPTNEESSPVQWVSAYSANEILYPPILPTRV